LKFVFVPLGSAGDVNPLTWLACLVAAQGHEVSMVVQAAMAEIPARAGLRVVAVGSLEEQQALLGNPDLWHPDRAFPLLASNFAPWAREMIPAIRAEIVPGRTVLAAGALAFGARIVAEADRVPLATIQLQPSVFMSADDRPVLHPRFAWLAGMPAWVWRAFLSLSHVFVDAMVAKPLNTLRAEMGLRTPVRRLMREWWMSPECVLALFPEWFAPKHADWPPQTVLTRFPLYDEAAARPMQPDLERFLAAGEPPILFTPGSANMWGAEFFAAAVEACRRLGRRGLFVTNFPERLAADLPPSIGRFDYVPFSRVFPRCAAVVHHGGIGTVSQAFAAGVPQLLMPMAHDQPDHARRLKEFGVGDSLRPARFRGPAVADKLAALLSSTAVASACTELKRRMAQQMPPEAVAGELIGRLGKSGVTYLIKNA
jgi:UDP:flavonoid glycosyltransferase YjiC (YdhE family)